MIRRHFHTDWMVKSVLLYDSGAVVRSKQRHDHVRVSMGADGVARAVLRRGAEANQQLCPGTRQLTWARGGERGEQ